MDDDFTDYSCSTSIERLSRDVETILRRWHVDKGSDRHYSTSQNENKSTVRSLRIESFMWNLSFYTGQERIHCDFDLELTLWDGPRPPRTNSGKLDTKSESLGLPHSLNRIGIEHYSTLDTHWMDNFSSAFGIGQHITLQPVNASCLSTAADKPLNPAYRQLMEHLLKGLTRRNYSQHQNQQLQVHSILTSWLQMALNVAASHGDCRFPVLGIWGKYHPEYGESSTDNDRKLCVLPEWARIATRIQTFSVERNQDSIPCPVVSGSLFAIESDSDDESTISTTLTCYAMSTDHTNERKKPSWTIWGEVLLQQCQHEAQLSFVYLQASRHTYGWVKQRTQRNLFKEAFGASDDRNSEWRLSTETHTIPRQLHGEIGSTSETAIDLTGSMQRSNLRLYLQSCQRYALKLIKRALGYSMKDPVWGPPDDPIEAMHLIISWSGTDAQPLLVLPLVSRHDMSLQDRQEMEYATESAIFDIHRSSACILKTYYDNTVAHATLAGTQRCVLAALIRMASLPKETLLAHMVDESVLEQWDAVKGDRVAAALSEKANADLTTKSLVAAMDWSHATDDLIERWRAEEIVRKLFESCLAFTYPDPPDSLVEQLDGTNIHLKNQVGWKPMTKGAPPGRLLSLLFVEMARLRSPCSMSMIWIVFCEELRRRWDARESLPNMNYVPGLDSPPETCRCFSSVGGRGAFAAQIHSSEPDPDNNICLIGQKLQVFNLSLESVASEKRRNFEQIQVQAMVVEHEALDGKITSSKHKSTNLLNGDNVETPTSLKPLLNGSFLDGIVDEIIQFDDNRMDVEDNPPPGYIRKDEQNYLFFDAEECADITLVERRGARCPVQGATLVSNGEQLYAPYLQRPFPLTDDVVAERRIIFDQQDSARPSKIIQQRLEITHRFQQPKLLSDMCSFKAANPGAIFEDFVGWYGNPTGFLEFRDNPNLQEHVSSIPVDVKAEQLDKAAEAIMALEHTRDFWMKTWRSAVAKPAIEQHTLFDAESTAEMALDYLENIHPATLLCQVMAVNLSSALFVLSASIGETVKIRSVGATMLRLRKAIEVALQLLSKEATKTIASSSTSEKHSGMPTLMVSIITLNSCVKACEILANAEVIVSRAASFLHKLPQQYHLVEQIMQLSEGSPLSLRDDEAGRSAFLRSVCHQQRQALSSWCETPFPAMRDYLLHNTDDTSPCQLCVRHSDEGNITFGAEASGTLLTLTKTIKD